MKTQLLVCLFSMALLVASCRKREPTKAEKHRDTIEFSEETIVFTPDKEFDFTVFKDTCYYVGEVNDSTYFIKIDHADIGHVTGRYYPVGERNILEAHHFEIERKEYGCLLCTKEGAFPITFKIEVDTDNISGWFVPSFPGSTRRYLTFDRYNAPAFYAATSPRYTPSCPDDLLTFKKIPDVVYGHARGLWTSKPIRHEQMRKMLLQGIAQSATARRKNLELKMDIYLPDDSLVSRRPTIVLLHGGGFFFGDKGAETSTAWCEHFARIGYVAVSANYRLGVKLTKGSIQQCGYEAVQDAHAALRFLLANADQYGIDTNNIFIGGTSAGAITALGAAFMTDNNAPSFVEERHLLHDSGPLHSSGNSLTRTPRIKAVANMWGAVYDLRELEGHQVPVISFHGTADNTVPYDEGYPFSDLKTKIGERLCDKMYGSAAIHRKLDSLHVRNIFYPIEGAGHAPYEDKRGKPNETYLFIQHKIQDFFYNEINRSGAVVQDKKDSRRYRLQMKDLKWCSWAVDGGFIVSRDDDYVTVLWRSDAKNRQIVVSGERQNGCAFQITKTL